MDTATLTRKLLTAEVPCGPINSIDQAFNDPQVQHLELVQKVTGSKRQGHFRSRASHSGLSRTPSKLTVRTPEFAEHTDEVLVEFGFGASEIKALARTRRRGIAAQPQLSAHPTGKASWLQRGLT